MSNNAHDLSNRLLNALDNNYNVVDMHAVNEIISYLEKFNITKELLETTRLGKHVNELRRKTVDPTLARRAKVLVKRWRDLVIPSPGPTGTNRSSAERQVRRLGGTPLTSPALARHVVSPAVNSPRPPSRPAWGGYESDSQDVILVDDDPPPPAPPALAPPPPPPSALHRPTTSPAKRAPSPEAAHDDKKAKRDKKPKKRRGHSRAGTGAEAPGAPPAASSAPAAAPAAPAAWGARNGAAHTERRRNGCRRDAVDPYTALVNKIPQAGAKKVKTTKELLKQIQSRGARPPAPPAMDDDDVLVVEDACPLKVNSPLRNGGSERASPPRTPSPPPAPLPPLEDSREYAECTCEDGAEGADGTCPAASSARVSAAHVHALHHVYLPGINGTRAPTHPHQYAVRKLTDPDKPGLFTSVVPLFKYSDYADDYCAKNMSRVPLCTHLPWTEFAPPPPDLPPPPSPPPLRPYPTDTPEAEPESEIKIKTEVISELPCAIEAEMVSVPSLEPSERLKAPLLLTEEVTQFGVSESSVKMDVDDEFKSVQQDHRTVERTKEDVAMDGRTLYRMCGRAIESVPYSYSQTSAAPVVTLPLEPEEVPGVLEAALTGPEAVTSAEEFGRPPRPAAFTEWHECARLGDLIALPYVVID